MTDLKTPAELDAMTTAELADYYNATRDLSEFEGGEFVPVDPAPPGTRSVTLSIRLTPEELETLADRAEAAGMAVTAYIRGSALEAGQPPVDPQAVMARVLAQVQAAMEGALRDLRSVPTGLHIPPGLSVVGKLGKVPTESLTRGMRSYASAASALRQRAARKPPVKSAAAKAVPSKTATKATSAKATKATKSGPAAKSAKSARSAKSAKAAKSTKH